VAGLQLGPNGCTVWSITEIGVSAPEVPCQIVGIINLFFMHFALCSKFVVHSNCRQEKVTLGFRVGK
jgi:hypothetical protein